VRDPKVHEEVIYKVIDYAGTIGLCALALEFSPIKGPEGNIEYLLHLKNHMEGTTFLNDGIQAREIVEKAHEALAG